MRNERLTLSVSRESNCQSKPVFSEFATDCLAQLLPLVGGLIVTKDSDVAGVLPFARISIVCSCSKDRACD